MMLHLLSNVQNVCKNHLRHRWRAVCRDVGYHDTFFAGGIDVDHIVARGQHTDVFKIGQCLHDFGGNDGFVCQNCLGTCRALYDLFGGSAVVNGQFAQLAHCIPRQIAGV
ncbi:hypothetical protein SDC9_131665 [bioreactor metagenome]|uniref:Uncharacterized protein n=1 Tax=bioreactor metagenome TaxID=1076179 RepID=A0A645D7J6_9ZZZZ